MAKASKPPQVADPDARAKIEAAAKAVGLTPEELADLMVDAGQTALPASDGITKRYTLEDLGVRLWGELQGTPKSRRAEWFDKLVNVQKAAVVVTLRDRGFRTEVIANDLGISATKVRQTYNGYAAELGSQVVGIRLDTIAGQMQMTKERAQQMAAEDGDHSALWRIEKEHVGVLQSIGIVDKAAQKVHVTHDVTQEVRAEIDGLLAVEQKKLKRQQEIKMLQAAETDDLPDEVTKDYDEDDDS